MSPDPWRPSEFAWVALHRDGALRRYARTLPGPRRPAVLLIELYGDPHDLWQAELLLDDERRSLSGPCSLRHALTEAEAELHRRRAPWVLTGAAAPWRQRRPSELQLTLARRWSIPRPEQLTAGDLSDALDRAILHARLAHPT